MTREEDVHVGLVGLIEELAGDADDPMAQVVTARILKEQLPAVLQEVVDRARERGASWQDLATGLGLKSPSSAHWHYGSGRPAGDAPPATKADRLDALRGRTKSPRPPAPELPGLTRKQAAEFLGCDPKTVASRAERLAGVRVEVFTARSGSLVRRYFII